jgi:hypothetical protein
MENKNDPTNKIFRYLLDFVYKELLNQFINNNGNCKCSTFQLINWSVITEKRTDGTFLKIFKTYVIFLSFCFFKSNIWKVRGKF